MTKLLSDNQKIPSKWMLIAILQSSIWLFLLPIICQKYWKTLFGAISNEVAELLIITVTPIATYIIYSIGMLPIYYIQNPFFEQFKIQKDRSWPWLDSRDNVRHEFWELISRSIKLTSVNLFVLLPIMGAFKIYISKLMNLQNSTAFDVDEHWPTNTQNIYNLLLLTMIHEFGFYCTHRMMHTLPSLYKYHKIHHEYKTNITLASQHNHPIDFIMSIGGPALLAALIVQTHSVTLFQFSIYTLYANLDDHVGYSFPWSPVRWFPFSAATDEHEFHHSKNLGCFASKISIFNILLGGYEFYSEQRQVQKVT